MRRLSILAGVVLLAGTTGLLWAEDLNPQPLPPGATGGGSTERKAGENPANLTQHDQNQISGNLNGDGKTGNSMDKWQKGMEKPQTGMKKSNGLIKGEKGLHKNSSFMKDNSKAGATGGGGAGKVFKADKGNQKVLIGLNKGSKLQKANGLQKGNGFIKGEAGFQKANGMNKAGVDGGANQLPAVQTSH